jgi:hypothetical protein
MVRPDVSRRQSSRVGPPSFFHFYADSKRQNSALAFGYERNSGWTVVFEPCRKRFGWPLWGCRSANTREKKGFIFPSTSVDRRGPHEIRMALLSVGADAGRALRTEPMNRLFFLPPWSPILWRDWRRYQRAV